MKKSEITVGGLYRAKVSGRVVTVKVEAIREVEKTMYRNGYTGMRTYYFAPVYDVLNTATGRRTTFRSAARFRGNALTDAQQAQRLAEYTARKEAFRNVRELHAQY